MQTNAGRVDKKRQVLSLSQAERAEEKRSSYWWLSRRWALGFAELSSLKASRLALRGAIYFQPRRTGGGLDSGTQGQPTDVRCRRPAARAVPGLNDCDAPAAPSPPPSPGLSLGRPQASHSPGLKLLAQRSAPQMNHAARTRTEGKAVLSHAELSGRPSQMWILRLSYDKHTEGPLSLGEW